MCDHLPAHAWFYRPYRSPMACSRLVFGSKWCQNWSSVVVLSRYPRLETLLLSSKLPHPHHTMIIRTRTIHMGINSFVAICSVGSYLRVQKKKGRRGDMTQSGDGWWVPGCAVTRLLTFWAHVDCYYHRASESNTLECTPDEFMSSAYLNAHPHSVL